MDRLLVERLAQKISNNENLKNRIKRTPGLGWLARRMRQRDLTLAQSNMVFYLPYLEHCNLPTPGKTGASEQSKAGYSKARLMYQYRKTEVLKHSGERFHHIFQDKLQEAQDRGSFRVFIIGGSVAFGHGAEDSERYYNVLERRIKKVYPVKVIPAAVSAINSTQETILFDLVVLPLQPNFVVILNGWNDIVLPSLFSVRPGDPMTMSTLYQKYYHRFFNLLVYLAQRSSLIDKWVLKTLQRDRSDFLEFFFANPEFVKTVSQSVINVYLSNLENIIEGCRLRNIGVLHFLQPSADVLVERSTILSEESRSAYKKRMEIYPWANVGLGPFINETYAAIEKNIASKPWANVSCNMLNRFTLDHFLDPAHLNALGQAVLAEALHQHLDPRLPEQKPQAGWSVL
jgi:lysophospholipase L1-like esterase